MAETDPKKEEIVYKLDGVKVTLESLSPEVRADVERRVKEARASYASKYPTGKLRMNINVKAKTSAAARKTAGAAPPPPIVIDDAGSPRPIIVVFTLILIGGLYLFVPAVTKAVDSGLALIHRKR